MTMQMNRRTALGLGSVVAAGAVLAHASPAAADPIDPTASDADPAAVDSTDQPPAGPHKVRALVFKTYVQQIARAGGIWNAVISVANADGTVGFAVEDRADDIVEAFSVNKVRLRLRCSTRLTVVYSRLTSGSMCPRRSWSLVVMGCSCWTGPIPAPSRWATSSPRC